MKELNIKISKLTSGCIVTLDDQPVGLIQSIKVEIDAYSAQPKVEIVFPDIRHYDTSLTKDLFLYVEEFAKIPYVTVILAPVEQVSVKKPDSVKDNGYKKSLDFNKEWSATEMPADPKDLKDPRDQ